MVAKRQQLDAVDRAVKILEGIEGVSEPTNSNLIEGSWQLMFTTRSGSASPIQTDSRNFRPSSIIAFNRLHQLEMMIPRHIIILR